VNRPDVVVMLCRDCCCGTSEKHPRTDHDEQLLALEDAVADNPAIALRVVDCLDECDRSNVAVVRRPQAPKGRRDTWFGGLLAESSTRSFAAWLADGADADSLPQPLRTLTFKHVPPRR
jgi:predicted metal-binding protein